MTEGEDLEFMNLIRSAMPDHMISNFIAVCEVLNGEGVELEVVTSQSMTPWLGIGMLQSALNSLQGTEDIYLFGNDEIEDEE